MRYWLHEIAGWLLLAVGLYLLFACFSWLLDATHILEAGVLCVIGLIVFRGGLHLIKLSVAARVCLAAQAKTAGEPKRTPASPMNRGTVRPMLRPRV